MASGNPRWVEVSDSQYAHEREGLAYIKTHLPVAPPYRAWTNFEFMDEQGRWHEVDALVLGRGRLHLVELKYYKGSLSGTEATWLRNGFRTERSPLLLARRKAQRLASRISKELATFARKKGFDVGEVTGWLPFIQESVFLHHPDLDVDLGDLARSNLFGYPDAHNDLPDIMSRLLEPAGSNPVQDKVGAYLTAIFRTLGIARRTTREAGSWLINGSPIAEGDGWQDWPAEHKQNADDIARIRVFPCPAGSPQSALTSTRRRVNREFQLLQALSHDNIVTPRDQVETEEGDPGLVYRVDKDFRPLDLLLEDNDTALTAAQRMIILERTAGALAYAHRHQVAHRGLNPHAILVQLPGGPDSEPRVQLADWSWAGRVHQKGTAGVTAVGVPSGAPEVDGSELYEAPEGRWSAVADRPSLDISSLGAVAYHLLTGSPPAGDRAGLREKLKAGRGLDLAAADVPFADEELRDLIRTATSPKISDRLKSAREFADRLRTIRETPGPTAAQEGDPLAAAPGALISGRFLLKKILGSGSTATGLLVQDKEAEDEERVLKVARNDDAVERLLAEEEVLEFLAGTLPEKVGVVRLLEPRLELAGSPKRTALLLISGGESTLGELTRFDALSVGQLESLGGQLLDIVVALEGAGVLHRDIKPANLGLTRLPGGRNRLTLFDFSLARGRVTAFGAGTPPYLDPFLGGRARPAYDSAAEWYAAAVVLFEMATTTTPLYGDDASNPEVITDDVTVEPGYFPSCVGQPAMADSLTAFFRQALSRDAKNRFDTADTMRTAWKNVFSAIPPAAKKTARVPVPAPARPVTTVDAPMVLPEGLRTLTGLARELARTAGGSGTAARRLVYLLLPIAPTEQDVDPLATQGVLAEALRVTQARVAQLFGELDRKWAEHGGTSAALAVLARAIREELAGSGGAATPALLAAVVLGEFTQEQPGSELLDADRTVTGLVRLLLELGGRATDPLEKRRYNKRIVTVGVNPLRLDMADAVAAAADRMVRDASAIGRHLIPGRDAVPVLRRETSALLVDPAVGAADNAVAIPDKVMLRLAAIRPDAVGAVRC